MSAFACNLPAPRRALVAVASLALVLAGLSMLTAAPAVAAPAARAS